MTGIFKGFEPPSQPPENHAPNKLSIEIMASIEVLTSSYRKHHKLRFDEVLTHKQIADVLDGIRDVIYKKEGISKPRL